MLLALLWACRAPRDDDGFPEAPQVQAPDTGAPEERSWPLTAAQVPWGDSATDSTADSDSDDSGDSGQDTASGEWPGVSLNYQRVAVLGYTSCALTSVGKIVCWGYESTNQLDVPPGIFLEIGISGARICALREDGEIICWGDPLNQNFEYPPSPTGKWARMKCQDQGCVALDEEGHLTWWAQDPAYFISYAPPEGQFIDIDIVASGVCALTISRDIRCWYKDDPSADTVTIRLEGNFKKISGTLDYGCGLDGDGNIECWTEFALDAHPRGYRWKDLSITEDWNCGIIEDGTPTCWGCVWGRYCGDVMEIPNTPIVDISSDMDHACGLTLDNRFVCWGWDWYGETQPPEEYR